MTSNINYAGINEQFPVAGQDNDTQVFRDNFDTIKTSLRVAQEEITEIQNSTGGLQTTELSLNAGSDFNLKIIQNAVFKQCREKKFSGNEYVSGSNIDWQNGSYQTWVLVGNSPVNMEFTNFPGDPVYTSETNRDTVGRMTLEFKSSPGASVIINFISSNGTVIKKDPNFPSTLTIDDSENPVIIEVWRHNTDTIYMRYLGKFA